MIVVAAWVAISITSAAVLVVVALVVGHRTGARRRPPRPHCPDSYWAGYRKGHSDGQLFALIRERNPSRN
jgi:hypothetical protein